MQIPPLAKRLVIKTLRRAGLVSTKKLCPWRIDRQLSPHCVSQVILHQFPELRSANVVQCGEGWEHEVYEVDDKWIFRFPKRQDVQRRLMVELSLLPILKSRLPVPIPEYRFTGTPSEIFPYAFAGYEKLAGERASNAVLDEPARARLARDLGILLSALHSFPCDLALQAGVSAEGWHPSVAAYCETAQRMLRTARNALSKPLVLQCQRMLNPRMMPGGYRDRVVLVHQDLSPRHILLKPEDGSIAGVIDWTSLAVTDPAADFLWLWMWLGEDFVRAVLTHYQCSIDDGFLNRVRFIATCISIMEVAFGLETRDDCKLSLATVALKRAFGVG